MRTFQNIVVVGIFALNTACDIRAEENTYSFPLLSSCRQQVVSFLSESRSNHGNELDFELFEFDSQLPAFRDVVGYVVMSSDSLDDTALRAIANNPILDCYPTEFSVLSEPVGSGKVEEVISLYSQMGNNTFYVYITPENSQVYSSNTPAQN